MAKILDWLKRKGAYIDPLLEERMEQWEEYKKRKEFEEKLDKLELKDVISDELRKELEKQSEREMEEIMKEMAKFGGEPPDNWIFYYDASGLHEKKR